MKKTLSNHKKILALVDHSSKAERNMISGLLGFCDRESSWELRILDSRTARFAKTIKDVSSSWKPDGIIANTIACTHIAEAFPNPKTGPVRIAIDAEENLLRHFNGAVLIDNGAVAKAAYDLFVSKRIAHVAYIGTIRAGEKHHSMARESALVKLTGKERSSVFKPDDSPPMKLIGELSKMAKWLKGLPVPCGVMAYCDERAVQVINACRMAKIKIPEQIALIGVDNDTGLCENLQPTLTSAQPDFEGAGYLAGKILSAIFDSRRLPKKTLIRRYGMKKLIERESTRDSHGGRRIVNAARAHIFAHACAGDGVKETAQALRISSRLLEIRFKEITGHTIREEITTTRLNMVRHLLRETSRTLSDIAFASGFGTVTAMMISFKKMFGIPPGTYRKNFLSHGAINAKKA